MAKRLTETAGSNGPPVADPETERNFMRKLTASKQDVDVYVGIHRNILKQAKKAGCNTTKMLAAMQAKNVNLPDVIADIKDYIRYCAMMNMPITQVELFGESAEAQIANQRTQDDRTWDAGEAGYAAGKAGRSIDECPHTPGSEEDAEWRKQWHRGQEHLVKSSLGKPSGEGVAASDRRQRTGSTGTRGQRRNAAATAPASSLKPDTAEDVRTAVAEDDAADEAAEE